MAVNWKKVLTGLEIVGGMAVAVIGIKNRGAEIEDEVNKAVNKRFAELEPEKVEGEVVEVVETENY